MIKLYDQNVDKIKTYKKGDTVVFNSANVYIEKLTEAQLNSMGLYYVEFGSVPNRRYYTATPTKGMVGSKSVVGYTSTEKPLEEVHDAMLKDLKEAFSKYSERPRVTIPSGITVDGGRADLSNFEIGLDLNVPIIKDADNVEHAATVEIYNEIILSIKQYGLSLWSQKNAKENEINALATVADCIYYENEPYDYTVTQEDVDADIEGTLTVGDIIPKTRNNVKEW